MFIHIILQYSCTAFITFFFTKEHSIVQYAKYVPWQVKSGNRKKETGYNLLKNKLYKIIAWQYWILLSGKFHFYKIRVQYNFVRKVAV